METDVQVQPEETGVEETPAQTTETIQSDSEVEKTPEKDGGDLRVALAQEREKRRELEQRTQDPMFIYEQAKRLGLTDEQAQEAADEGAIPTQPGQNSFTYSDFAYYRDLDKSREKYPELSSDENLQVMVTALINKGMNPLKAADTVFERFAKASEEAKLEGAAQAKTEISEKEQAQTVSSTRPSSGDAEMEDLIKRSKSLDRRIQEPAMIELMKRRMK